MFTTARAQVTPYSANAFVESIGVNVHWGYTDRVYYSEFPEIKKRLAELGIRHVRDGTTVNEKPTVVKRINELYEDLGVRTTFITGRRKGGYPNPLDVSLIGEELQALKKNYPIGLIEALEGPNEYDISHNKDPDKGGVETDWVGKVKKYQQELHQRVEADPDLRDIPVIGPSFTSERAYRDVGNLDESLDFVCIHPYKSWRHPGTDGWGGSYGSIGWNLEKQAAWQSADKPVQATECGYHNYQTKDGGVPETTQGKYVTRTFAEFFRRGIARSFEYELIDQGPLAKAIEKKTDQLVYGLLRNDRSRKPAFYAVAELIDLLSDPGNASFETTALDYRLDDTPEDVRELLLQKRDGTYYLLLWREVESYDYAEGQKKELSPDPRSVTVQFPNSIQRAQLYRQGLDGKMSDQPLTVENSTVTLNVYDRMQVIELSGTTPVVDNDFPDPDQWYFLENRECAERLDTDNCNADSPVDVSSGQDLDKQWRFVSVGEGYYALQNRCSDRWLTTSGEQINLQAGSSTSQATHWKLVEASSGWYYLRNREESNHLDTDECGVVDANNPGTNPDKQWQLIPAGEVNARVATGVEKTLLDSATVTTKARRLVVYPNPSSDGAVALQLTGGSEPVPVRILNLKGKVVYQGVHAPGLTVLDTHLPPGLYLVKVSDLQGTLTEKLLVK